jgi:hypothetical protein
VNPRALRPNTPGLSNFFLLANAEVVIAGMATGVFIPLFLLAMLDRE